jgi:hypothetical protein
VFLSRNMPDGMIFSAESPTYRWWRGQPGQFVDKVTGRIVPRAQLGARTSICAPRVELIAFFAELNEQLARRGAGRLRSRFVSQQRSLDTNQRPTGALHRCFDRSAAACSETSLARQVARECE